MTASADAGICLLAGPKGVQFEQNLLGSGSCVLVHWVVHRVCGAFTLQPPRLTQQAAGESATTGKELRRVKWGLV